MLVIAVMALLVYLDFDTDRYQRRVEAVCEEGVCLD
jgi:hypothetical protein